MKNFILQKVLFLSFLITSFVLFPADVFADLSRPVENQYLEVKNLVVNPGFENGPAGYQVSVPATVVQTTVSTEVATGLFAVKFNPTTGGQYIRTPLVPVPTGMFGRACIALIRHKGGSNLLTFAVENATPTTIASQIMTVNATFNQTKLAFTCPASGQFRVKVESTGDAPEAILDDLYLGLNYVEPESAGFLRTDGTNSPSTNIDWGGNKLTGIATATAAQDAVNKTYADQFLKRDGTNAASANLNIGGFKLSSVGTPTLSTDAATKGYVDTAGFFKADGSVPATGNFDLNGNKITSLGTPTTSGDATNKSYVDGFLKRDGTNSPTASISWGNQALTGLSSLQFNTDGVGNIGSVGATRPDNIYVKTSGVIDGTVTVGVPSTPTGGSAPNGNITVKSTVTNGGFLSVGDGSRAAVMAIAYGDSNTFRGYRASGTATSPAATGAVTLTNLEGFGYDGTSFALGSYIEARSGTTWTPSDHESFMRFGVTPSGSTTPQSVISIQSNGSLTWVSDGGGSIGASGANRPNNIFALNNITAGGTVTAPTFSGNLTGNVTGNLTGNVTGAASLNVLKAGDTMTGALLIPSGTALLPAISLSADADADGTGFYRVSTNRIGITNNGVLSHEFGQTVYHTTGGIQVDNASGVSNYIVGTASVPLVIKAVSGDSNGLKIWEVGGGDSKIIGHFAGNLVLGTNNTEYLTMASNGNTTLTANLTLNSGGGPMLVVKDGGTLGTNADPHIEFQDGVGAKARFGFLSPTSTNLRIFNIASGNIELDSASATAIKIKNTTTGHGTDYTEQPLTTRFKGNLFIGSTATEYPYVGHNARTSASAGVYNYEAADTASVLRFQDGGFQFRGSSTIGTIGNAITFVDHMTVNKNGVVMIGTNTAATSTPYIDFVRGTSGVVTGLGHLRLADVTTDAVGKQTAISLRHTTNAEEDVGILYASGNTLRVGGGVSALNTMTSINFYTAATATTTGGTDRGGVDSSGGWTLGDTSYSSSHVIRAGALSFNHPTSTAEFQLFRGSNDGSLSVMGGGGSNSPSIDLFGASHASAPGETRFYNNLLLSGYISPANVWVVGNSTSLGNHSLYGSFTSYNDIAGATEWGFFNDVNAGGTDLAQVVVGNSGTNQGRARFSFTNAAATGSPSASIAFDPRNNADTTNYNAGRLLFTKNAASNGSTLSLQTSTNAPVLTTGFSLDESQQAIIGPASPVSQLHQINGEEIRINSSGAGNIVFSGNGGSPSRIIFNNANLSFRTGTLASNTEMGVLNSSGQWDLGQIGSTQQQRIRGNELNLVRANAGETFDIIRGESTGAMRLIGGTGIGSSYMVLYGGSHATKPEVVEFGSNNGLKMTMGATGQVTIGTTGAATDTQLFVRGGPLHTSTNQYGIYTDTQFNSAATASGAGIASQFRTAAAAFTVPVGRAFAAESPSLGAGSAVTRYIGYHVSSTQPGSSNAMFSDNTSFTGNYGIHLSTTNDSVFQAGNVRIGTSGLISASNERLSVRLDPNNTQITQQTATFIPELRVLNDAAVTATQTVLSPILRRTITTSQTDTGGLFGYISNTAFNIGSGATLTSPQSVGIYVNPPSLSGAGSLALTSYGGIRIDSSSLNTGTRKYGLLVGPQTGAATGNAEITDNTTYSGNYTLHFTNSAQSFFTGPIRIGATGPNNGFTSEEFTSYAPWAPSASSRAAGAFWTEITGTGNDSAGNNTALSATFRRNTAGASPTDTTAISAAATLEYRYAVASGQTYTNANSTGASGLFVAAPSNTASATIAQSHYSGVQVAATSLVTGANKYGLRIGDQTGATTNYAIKTGLGRVELGDTVVILNTGSNGIGFDGEPSTTNLINLRRDQNALTRFIYRNTHAGASAIVRHSLVGDAGDFNFSADSIAGGGVASIISDATFTGGMLISAAGSRLFRLQTNATDRLRVQTDGAVNILAAQTAPFIFKAIMTNGNGLTVSANTATDVAQIINGYSAALELGTNGTVVQSISSGGVTTFTNSAGPQVRLADGGTFATNADPYLSFRDSSSEGGRVGFTSGASSDLELRNLLAGGAVKLSTNNVSSVLLFPDNSTGHDANFAQVNMTTRFRGTMFIGRSATEYPFIGFNTRSKSGANSYDYDSADTASMIRFDNGGFLFRGTATVGSIGGAITFTDNMSLSNVGKLVVGASGGTQQHDFRGQGVGVDYGTSGSTAYIQAVHSSNTANSNAMALLRVAGSSAGDPFISFSSLGEADWTAGLDNSDANKFKVSFGTVLGSNDFLTINSDGLNTVGALALKESSTVNVTADNQAVSPTGKSLIYLNSDDATAANRTFTLSAGVAGQVIVLIFTDATDAVELLDTGTMMLSVDWVPTVNDTLSLISDGTNWRETARSAN